MICALWGVDLKFPSPLVPRPVALASRASPHPSLQSLSPLAPRRIRAFRPSRPLFCSPCSFAHFPSFRASRASPVTRASRPASPAMENSQRKTVFMTTVPGVSDIAKITFFSLQPLSWRHCKNHFLSIISQTPLDACLAPRHAMLGGCGPPPPGEALRRPPRHARRFRHGRHSDILTSWHSGIPASKLFAPPLPMPSIRIPLFMRPELRRTGCAAGPRPHRAGGLVPIDPGKEKGRGRSSGEPRSASQGVSPGESQTSAEGAERPLPMPCPTRRRGPGGGGGAFFPLMPLACACVLYGFGSVS